MRPSWNEIQHRAIKFSEIWKDARYEKRETQSFWNEFFEIFGVRRRLVARYEEKVNLLNDSQGFIDLFWPGVLLVEQKSLGKSLEVAMEQASRYFDALNENDRPRYQLVCDFQNFWLLDRDERKETRFLLAELPQFVEKFDFIMGVQRREFREQDPVNIQVAERIGQLHDALKDSGYSGHNLELFLVRLVFCLFADDTGIFERDAFLYLIDERTSEDGTDVGMWLSRLFQVLNTPKESRQQNLDQDLSQFPYVNGDLFEEPIDIADFSSDLRSILIDACKFDWSGISPAIFGVLFQSVLTSAERRTQGAHYTSEKSIMKVIEPLFLDDLRTEFNQLISRRDTRKVSRLENFWWRLRQLKFLDPACGCGNFLIIAYRELRMLEIEVISEIRKGRKSERQAALTVELYSLVNVDQFYGIELDELPVRIAETALWMMDHIMNNRISQEFGNDFTRIPLEKSPHIIQADALEMDWNDLLPSGECFCILGNPPFAGAKYQTNYQRSQVHRIANLKGGGVHLIM